MLRFLVGIGLWGLPWAVGSDIIPAAVAGATWAHPVYLVGVRAFAVRVRPATVESGHVHSDTPLLDTERS